MIEDNFFRFWYRFVPGNMSAIHAGSYGTGLRTGGEKHYSDYMGMRRKGRSYAADDGGSLPVAAVRQGVYLRIKKGMVLGKSSCQGGSFL